MENKISIIIPLYNSADTVVQTLNSIEKQSYKNWEVIIVNDGSTDESKETVEKYKKTSKFKKKYTIVNQHNADQLNAVLHAIEYITGDFVFILHSDDLLADDNMLQNALQYLLKDGTLDAVIGNLITVNNSGNQVGVQHVAEYFVKERVVVNQLLQLGRNQFIDVALYRKKAFTDSVMRNYLIWNTPFWLDFKPEPSQLNVEKIDLNFIQYRVFEDNYINNEIGMSNVINGELRTAINLMNYYYIPFYKIQNILSRFFKKIGYDYSKFIYFKKVKSKNYSKVIKYIISLRYPKIENYYLSSLINFYSKKTERSIYIDDFGSDFKLYYGKDVKSFSIEVLSGTLPIFYNHILNEMNIGFNIIYCKANLIPELKVVLKFLNISDMIEIKEEHHENT